VAGIGDDAQGIGRLSHRVIEGITVTQPELELHKRLHASALSNEAQGPAVLVSEAVVVMYVWRSRVNASTTSSNSLDTTRWRSTVGTSSSSCILRIVDGFDCILRFLERFFSTKLLPLTMRAFSLRFLARDDGMSWNLRRLD
jgi:hypothetical protein